MPLFDHDRSPGGHVSRSKISRELAELLCDLGYANHSLGYADDQRVRKAFGTCYLGDSFHHDSYRGKSAYDHAIKKYHYSAVDFARVDGLPVHWWCDVNQVKSWRAKAKHEADLAAKVDAFEAPPAVKRALVAAHRAGKIAGYSAPDIADLSGLKPIYGSSYKPEGGCDARLKLKSAVYLGCVQNSYSDDSVYLIPVEGEIGDSGACQRNLGRWCDAIRTHNGFAGSGSSYSASLVVEPDGAYVVLHCRASICD